MTAPALITLTHNSHDPHSAATVQDLINKIRRIRPDLHIKPAFLELSKPSFQTVIDQLVRAKYDEIVVVPLLLSKTYHTKIDVPTKIAETTARHENLQIRATDVLGLEHAFLDILDHKLHKTLCSAQIHELDALMLAAAGTSDPLATQSINRLAQL